MVHTPQTLHPKKFVDTAASTMPRWYVAANIKRGAIDPAIVKRGKRPARVAPIGFAYLTLWDELGVLIGGRTLTAEQGAKVFTDLRDQLEGLWRQATTDEMPRVFVEWPIGSEQRRIELEFLRRAVDMYRAATN